MLDVEALAQPAPVDAPGGPDLHYSAEYAALERAAAGKPERQVGNAIVPAEPPEWRAVLDGAAALLTRSKDLRVAVLLVRALLETRGFEGFGLGLALTRRLVSDFWPDLHPRLDAEDDGDPTARVTAMAGLVGRDLIQAVRATPLATSKSFGPITLRALDAPGARGAAALDAAFEQVPPEALGPGGAAVIRCAQEASALAAAWSEVLPSAGPDFAVLVGTLGHAQQIAKARMTPREAESASDGNGAAQRDLAGASGEAPRALAGEVRSRDDVLRAIDAICAYYARAEPSSPVPLLLQRSRRLVTMSFLDILKEMLPESVANLQKISGTTDR
jgi:type VI secretion system protein ImpA